MTTSMKSLRSRLRRRQRGSALVMVMFFVLLISFVISFTLKSSQEDTQDTYRTFYKLQARYLAEGAINRAKGDVLAQIASTNFLGGGAFETVDVKYATVNQRFDNPANRIPAEMPADNINWKSSDIIGKSLWNFTDNTSLKIPGTNNWGPGTTGSPMGNVRVYVTRSFIDNDGNAATNAVGAYSITLTAAVQVGNEGIMPTEFVLSKSFQHQLSFPPLFNYLILGNRVSDCSICHLKFWGDMGQVDPTDPLEMHIGYNSVRFNRTSVYGSIYLNGQFLRNATSEGQPDNKKQERMLWTPGANGQFIYCSNGGTLFNQFNSDGSASGGYANPFRSIDSLARPLPTTWPSVKGNLLNWFEPRNLAGGSGAYLTLKVRDNNIEKTGANGTTVFTPYNGIATPNTTNDAVLNANGSPVATNWWDAANTGVVTQQIGPQGTAAADPPYWRAIDRVAVSGATGANAVTKANANGELFYDRGLHPADDLDGDTIPNVFDADMDGDGVPETTPALATPAAAGTNPNHLLTSASLASCMVYESANTNLGKVSTWNAGTGTYAAAVSVPANRWRWQPGYQNVSGVWNRHRLNAPAQTFGTITVPAGSYIKKVNSLINNSTRSAVYAPYTVTSTDPSVHTYRWNAKLSGMSNTMKNLINNSFEKSDTAPTANVLYGVYPNGNKDGSGNPVYDANRRNLIILGNTDNPIVISGQVTVRGDILIGGLVSGRGSIITHRNVFLPQDLKYKNPPNWNDVNDKSGDMLGLVSGGNILVGNIMHNTTNRTDMMEFVWGNMMNNNDPNVQTWNWGIDGTAVPGSNHKIQPIYLMDGAEGGKWVNGQWMVDNAGNTVANTFNAQGMKIGGGLVANTSNPAFNSARKHLHFGGLSNSNSTAQTSRYKAYYISTPGLLPLGASTIASMPASTFGTFTNSTNWLTSDDFKFFTLFPRDSANNYWTNGLGGENRNNWLKNIDGVLYADNGVIGGNIATAGPNFMEYKGAVIGREIQLLSAIQYNANETETKFTNNVGSLYYDHRLRDSINPLGFQFDEAFVGGEMTMNNIPPDNNGDRDAWEPFRMKQAYNTLFQLPFN